MGASCGRVVWPPRMTSFARGAPLLLDPIHTAPWMEPRASTAARPVPVSRPPPAPASSAPPPSPWRAHRAPPPHQHELFFLNVVSGERTWRRPVGFRGLPAREARDEAEQDAAHAAGPWIEYRDARGRAYYYNAATKLKQWTRPSGGLVPEDEAFDRVRAAFGVVDAGADERGASDASSTSSTSSSSSNSGAHEDARDAARDAEPEDVAVAFGARLDALGVTHVSRFEKWAPKLAGDAAFEAVRPERRRALFERHVRALVERAERSTGDALKDAKRALAAWWPAAGFATPADAPRAATDPASACRAALERVPAAQRSALVTAVHARRGSMG